MQESKPEFPKEPYKFYCSIGSKMLLCQKRRQDRIVEIIAVGKDRVYVRENNSIPFWVLFNEKGSKFYIL